MVFLVAGLQLVALVFSLDVGVLDRVLGDEVADQGVDDDGLVRRFHLRLDGRVFLETLLDRFLHHHFARDQVLLDGVAQTRRVRLLALGDHLLDDGVEARRRDGFSIDDCGILREGRDGSDGNEG